MFPLCKPAEGEGNRGLAGDGHRDQQGGKAPPPRPRGSARTVGTAGGGQSGEGGRNQHRAGLVQVPTSFPPFAAFPSFRRYSEGIPGWLQLKHHQPAFLSAGDTEKTPHPGPLPAHRSADAHQWVRSRTRESVLCHLAPLAPFSNPGHCRQSA